MEEGREGKRVCVWGGGGGEEGRGSEGQSVMKETLFVKVYGVMQCGK